MTRTLAHLLTTGSADAEAQLSALRQELGILLFPDHEGALLRGAFVQRRPIPRSQYLEFARSWEKFDRAFAPAAKTESEFALAQLERFVKRAAIAGDLGDHILFVIERGDVVERSDAPDILVSLGDDAWDEWLDAIGLTREHGEEAAGTLKERLLQDPHLHGQSPGPDR